MIHAQSAGEARSSSRDRKNFLDGSGMRYARYTKLISPSIPFLRSMIHFYTKDMEESAPIEVIEDIYACNPDTMLAIVKGDSREEPHASETGLICPLPLNRDG